MILRRKFENPQVLMQLGMLSLIIALFSQRFLHPNAWMGENLIDGLNGALMGMSIGLNLLYVVVRRRTSACAKAA